MTTSPAQATGTPARLEAVRERVRAACERAGRDPESVRIVAVGKRHPASAMRPAYAAGQTLFGENYVQELADKRAALADLPALRWRLVGRLQRNKAAQVVRLGCAVDTVDSVRLAEALQRRADGEGSRIEVLVQVNVAEEPQKAGCAPKDLGGLVATLRRLDALDLRGLMALPLQAAQPEDSRRWFRILRQLAAEHGLHELSMGMSADLEVAIEEGATMVRVGTAIFGARR
ncbi:MAG: YggS family pyridoxal phosphate-dependent enzyme [Proteobacteria bacterium]|nr:YggS family pyridoxal phosphate-dependent enzyme [Pseudomonadota bacterium]